MIDKEKALLAYDRRKDIHCNVRHRCTQEIGPRGGIKENITRCRPSGKVQTWKTRPDDFRLPIKHGLYESGEITQSNGADFHLAEDCPLLSAEQDATIH